MSFKLDNLFDNCVICNHRHLKLFMTKKIIHIFVMIVKKNVKTMVIIFWLIQLMN